MENFLNSLPKPVLVFGVMLFAVVTLFLINPPHTVCDTASNSVKDSLVGVITPSKINKKAFPAKITKAKENCEIGVSSGSCYEYFSILKTVAKSVFNAPLECAAGLFQSNDIRKTLVEGTEKMALLAWGDVPPEPGANRFNWFQESELALFCLLHDVHVRSLGNEDWNEFRKKIFNKYPAEALQLKSDPTQGMQERVMASTKFSESEIWARSLFSIRCENYR